ncbi:hypothetical protein K388_06772 [Streptomyces sp. KhCrAH-43]|nr:hypothetical protein K388_06772 [Streptomyces sp. KhCrAH-43]
MRAKTCSTRAPTHRVNMLRQLALLPTSAEPTRPFRPACGTCCAPVSSRAALRLCGGGGASRARWARTAAVDDLHGLADGGLRAGRAVAAANQTVCRPGRTRSWIWTAALATGSSSAPTACRNARPRRDLPGLVRATGGEHRACPRRRRQRRVQRTPRRRRHRDVPGLARPPHRRTPHHHRRQHLATATGRTGPMTGNVRAASVRGHRTPACQACRRQVHQRGPVRLMKPSRSRLPGWSDRPHRHWHWHWHWHWQGEMRAPQNLVKHSSSGVHRLPRWRGIHSTLWIPLGGLHSGGGPRRRGHGRRAVPGSSGCAAMSPGQWCGLRGIRRASRPAGGPVRPRPAAPGSGRLPGRGGRRRGQLMPSRPRCRGDRRVRGGWRCRSSGPGSAPHSRAW